MVRSHMPSARAGPGSRRPLVGGRGDGGALSVEGGLSSCPVRAGFLPALGAKILAMLTVNHYNHALKLMPLTHY